MGMDVDQPRRHQPALDADCAACVRSRQRRRDGADLASGDADVHQAAQPAGRIEHVAASKQKVVFHRPLHATWLLMVGHRRAAGNLDAAFAAR
jgi:hypothetical protein